MAFPKSLFANVENVPSTVQRRIKEGFGLLSTLSPSLRSELFARITAIIKSGAGSANLDPLVALTSLTTQQVGSILTALSATIGLVVQNGVTTAEFLDATRGKFFDPEEEPVVIETVEDAIAGSADWNVAFDRRRLANETLPALGSFNTSIDLRLRFQDDTIQDGVPVALLHIDTDAEGQEIWFQAGRGDVEMMLVELQKALREMDLAEQLYNAQRSNA